MATRTALLIGNARYRDFAALSVPAADVDGLAAVLADPAIGAFDAVRVLQEPSFAAAHEAVGEL